MTAIQLLFQEAAQFYFQPGRVRRHSKMHIEKTMIHRLEREGEAERSFSRRIGYPFFYLGEPRHGANGHIGSVSAPITVCSLRRGTQSKNPLAHAGLGLFQVHELQIVQAAISTELLHQFLVSAN